GKGGKHVRPEEEGARRGKREIETFEQPQRQQRLNGEAACKRIKTEQRGELVDLEQIGRQDDGGEAVAEAARRPRGVEIEDVGASRQAELFEQATVQLRQLQHRLSQPESR